MYFICIVCLCVCLSVLSVLFVFRVSFVCLFGRPVGRLVVYSFVRLVVYCLYSSCLFVCLFFLCFPSRVLLGLAMYFIFVLVLLAMFVYSFVNPFVYLYMYFVFVRSFILFIPFTLF